MKKLFSLSILFIWLGSISAQSFVKHFSTGFNSEQSIRNIDSIKILAVMVDFQEDKYDGTIGTGKFGSHFTQTYNDTILDPLPHDAGYFSDHLEFAKNYFRKVSGGKVNVSYKVLPYVITVSKTMRNYSLDYNSDDYSPVGNFAKEVWELADKKFTNEKFSNYNLFMIFHAGVSSGLDDGNFTIDKNIPSLYLNLKTFQKIYGNQFVGFSVNNGSYLIKNSLIMPETETREYTNFGQTYLEQISLNGFLVANIASHLGLPDLFNTETGKSAIGRFGLMDPQAMISYPLQGMFPPEPSAWEKMFLGWIQPITLGLKDTKVNIATRNTDVFGDTTLLKIPINSSEYYLIENRSQDYKKDNVIITYRRSGKTYTVVVPPDTSGRFEITPKSIPGGVVIDVDEFDAALPGSGILIWHNDDNIINSKIAENKINTDLDKLGVDVEEADGIQDIGVTFQTIFGPQIGEGYYEDFWYKGNKAKLYKNKFSYDTKPNTKSNNGANSFITIENFSAISNKMSFDVKFGESFIKMITSRDFGNEQTNSVSIPYGSSNYSIIKSGSNVKISKDDFKSTIGIVDFNNFPPASIYHDGVFYLLGSLNNKINIYIDNPTQGSVVKNVPVNFVITSPITIVKENNELIALAGTQDGSVLKLKMKSLALQQQADYSLQKIASEPIKQLCAPFENTSGYFVAITNSSIIDSKNNKYTVSQSPLKAILLWDKSNNSSEVIVLSSGNNFIVLKDGAVKSQFKINSSLEVNSFSVSNNGKTGKHIILLHNGTKLEGYYLSGITAVNFPITEPNGINFISMPLTSDINGDFVNDIFSVSEQGALYIYDSKTGKGIEPFPISIGSSVSTVPFIYRYTPLEAAGPVALQAIVLVDKYNQYYKWITGTTNDQPAFNSEFGNSMNNSTIVVSGVMETAKEFFPSDKAYNWPNPVYGNHTNIRYFVSENSTINIKIFDLSGDLVAELNNNATGGFENETVWDVANIQSGVYYARIEAKGDSGNTAQKIIKIAVIK